jgi:hypothetical protein
MAVNATEKMIDESITPEEKLSFYKKELSTI